MFDGYNGGPLMNPLARIQFEPCATCEGRGGEIEHDMQGDGVWMTPVTYFIACDDCLLNGLCPGCSRAIPADEAEIAAEQTDNWVCGACGWQLDDSRFEPVDPEPSMSDYRFD